MIEVKVKKIYKDVKVPEQATNGSAGFDLRAYWAIHEAYPEMIIPAGDRVKIGTGLKFELPEGYVMQIYPRGSMGIKKGLMLQNTVGILDADYRGECFLFLQNTTDKEVIIQHNERIAQAIILPYPKVNFVESEELSETERGEGKCGSTGKD